MPRNIELKARLASRDAGRRIAREFASYHAGEFRQVDTYFDCRRGRLKLRESFGRGELIAYQRADEAGPRTSEYRVVPVADAEAMKAALAAALGIRVVVDKSRDLFMWENVRIHLDTVKSLGEFIEFEAVLAEEQPDEEGYVQIQRLMEEFQVSPEDLVAGSYADLVEERTRMLA